MRWLNEIISNHPPLALPATASVKDACRQMHDMHLDSVVVTDDQGQLTGIFTEHDASCRVLDVGRDTSTTYLLDVMTPKPVTVPPERSAIEAMRLMWDFNCKHLPVVQGKHVIGVICRQDFDSVEEDCFSQERELWEHMR